MVTSTRLIAVSLVILITMSPSTLGQTGPPVTPGTVKPDHAMSAAPQANDESTRSDPPDNTQTEPPLPGPRLLDLRYDEDFSYLDGRPDTYRADPFDAIKNIHLDKNWRLNLGGEVRTRYEYEGNFGFSSRGDSYDSFFLYRFFGHADLRYRDAFRVFLQGASVWEDGRALGPRPIDENEAVLQQLFVDVKALGGDEPLLLRLGRQDLSYGAQRFVSPLDWANTRRRFDAAKIIWYEKTWQFDAFWSRPVPVDRTRFDNWDEDVDFFGAYWTYRGIPQLHIDLFAFGDRHTANLMNPNGRAGDQTRYTVGGRLHGAAHGFDYDAVLAGQWGSWANDNVEAWAWVVDAGYTFAGVPWRPRLGAGLDWASGDRDPRDGTVETFDQLYPLGHKYLGFMDFVGRQNIQAANVNLSAWPIANKLKARIAYHGFWLESRQDALYAASGAATRRDQFGNSGKTVGQELDLTLLCLIDVHQSVLLGYSHFFPGNFISSTGPSNDADFVYVHYRLKF